MSDHTAPLIAALIWLVVAIVFFMTLEWMIENVTEGKRRNQYRIIADFDDPARLLLQSRWKTLVGWSKWKVWQTYTTLADAEAGAREDAQQRIAKLKIPNVIKNLGVLP